MKCPHCETELSEGVNFCKNCGYDLKKKVKPTEMKKKKVEPKVTYGGFLAKGGWLIILAGVIYMFLCAVFGHGLGFYELIFTGIGVIISTVICSLICFGLYKAILKSYKD